MKKSQERSCRCIVLPLLLLSALALLSVHVGFPSAFPDQKKKTQDGISDSNDAIYDHVVDVAALTRSEKLEIGEEGLLSDSAEFRFNSSSYLAAECEGRRVYMHELPPEFNSGILSQCDAYEAYWLNFCDFAKNWGFGLKTHRRSKSWYRTEAYMVEIIFHERMKRYPCLAASASEADAFYIPYYSGLDSLRFLFGNDVNRSHEHGVQLVEWLQANAGELWARNGGADHFVVMGRTAWDFSRALHRREGWGTSLLELPGLLNVTSLVLESRSFPWQEQAIPYPTSFHPAGGVNLHMWMSRVRRSRRTFLFSFAGGGGTGNSPNIRHSIRMECSDNPSPSSNPGCAFIDCEGNKCDHDPGYLMRRMMKADFCLQPPGDTPTRQSTFGSHPASNIPITHRMDGRSDEKDAAASMHLKFAYYVTGHGFGHATRVVEVVRHLVAAGHEVHVVTGAPDFVFTSEISSSNLFLRKVLLDCGAVQADALTVDRLASLEKYSQTAVVPRASILATEVEWLKSIKANLVISDVVPVACRAAADAGIPSVCVTNFSWDFIYAEYVMEAGYHHRSIVWQIAEDYSHCLFLLRLPGFCPMPAFRDVIDVPLVVRKPRKSREEVRKELGIGDDIKLLVFNFGGQQASWTLKEESLPPGWICLVCAASPRQEFPCNFKRLPADVYTPDLIAACDCMLGKIGYGTVSEALAYKIPFVFVRRDYFNEEPFLRNMLEYYHGGVEMIRRDLLTGHWIPYLERALKLNPYYDLPINGGEVAATILQNTAIGKVYTSDKYSGARRLRDAIVLGFQLQRISGRDTGIPEWYTHAENELGLCSLMPSGEKNDRDVTSTEEIGVEEFEILHGDIHGFPDTVAFLKSLASLDIDFNSNDKTEKRRIRERVAAAGLFNWEDVIFVTRAPGRLDVMGGIADYSGSLVLQMPIREACHVAVQRSHPSKQRLWKHALARQNAKGEDFIPVMQIVSFGSEVSNRAPTFDMDLGDFIDADGPITYEKARKYFAQDPSQKWAAYVAGTILVLIRELGVQFDDGISILVSSGVPDGKGVSSSAALEVATMSAIAAAHGLNIPPRELALLCQKVENHIVGAPCGVMDQMTSACGEANKLLAMVCQPAEVREHVNIPSHIRFWGIDSGIRHSVGGADYGSVRVGTFMGHQIIKSTASTLLPQATASLQDDSNGVIHDELDEQDHDLLEKEATLDYLCNLQPHRYEAIYRKILPEKMSGQTFLDVYGHHNDPVTTINPKHTYGLKDPTAHPIYENFHVNAFAVLLTAASTDEQLSALGELLYQSHYSYSKCGLGSDGTDRLITLVQQMQHRKKDGSDERKGTLFGAKITGGGSGGTVCVLGRNCIQSSEEIIEIQKRYKAATGHLPFIFEGSSPGAGKFGYLKIKHRIHARS